MMQGLRGSGLNDSDRQIEGLEMRLVDVPTDQDRLMVGWSDVGWWLNVVESNENESEMGRY